MKTNVKQMTDREIYLFFRKDHFYNDPELAKAVCQELENREAARVGRKPAKVCFTKLGPKLFGRATNNANGEKIIELNEAFLMKLEPHPMPPAKAMNTIFHEGRHIWQYCVLENEDQRVPLSVRLLLRADNLCYTDGEVNVIDVGIPPEAQGILEYALQENEMDARFYALKRMIEVQKTAEMDSSFLIATDREGQVEVALIKEVISCFDEVKYSLLERKRLEMYKARAEFYRQRGIKLPKLPENFRCYQNIWMIRNIVRPVFDLFMDKAEGLRQDTMRADNLLLNLYAITRNCAAEGKPLESPKALLQIVMSGNLCKEFDLKQEAFRKELDKPIGM